VNAKAKFHDFSEILNGRSTTISANR